MTVARTTKPPRPRQKYSAAVRRGQAWICGITPEDFASRQRGVRLTEKQREEMRAAVRWLSEMLASEPPTHKP